MGYHVVQYLPLTYSAAGNSPYSVLSRLMLDPLYAGIPAALRMFEAEGMEVPGMDAFLEQHAEEIERLNQGDQIDHEAETQLKRGALLLMWRALDNNQDSSLWQR